MSEKWTEVSGVGNLGLVEVKTWAGEVGLGGFKNKPDTISLNVAMLVVEHGNLTGWSWTGGDAAERLSRAAPRAIESASNEEQLRALMSDSLTPTRELYDRSMGAVASRLWQRLVGWPQPLNVRPTTIGLITYGFKYLPPKPVRAYEIMKLLNSEIANTGTQEPYA